jgi:hypothetical protein
MAIHGGEVKASDSDFWTLTGFPHGAPVGAELRSLNRKTGWLQAESEISSLSE